MYIKDMGISLDESKLLTRDVSGVTTLYLHHSDGRGGAIIINEEHKENGWAGIGYNWVVRENGNIEKGRPIEYIPSGVKNFNTHSVHICFEGNFMIENITPEQVNAGKQLIDYVKSLIPSITTIKGHREDYPTDCPGDSEVGGNFPLMTFKNYFGNPSPTLSELKGSVSMRSIRNGEYSTRVELLQNILTGIGYTMKVDGAFGKETEDNVKKFQADNNLTVDGVVGTNTIDCLLSVVRNKLTS